MVTETNRYAEQYFRSIGGVDNLKPSARARFWKPVNEVDIKAFLGLILYMGIVRLPNYELYWSNEELLDLGMKRVMSRDLFQLIMSFFSLRRQPAAVTY